MWKIANEHKIGVVKPRMKGPHGKRLVYTLGSNMELIKLAECCMRIILILNLR